MNDHAHAPELVCHDRRHLTVLDGVAPGQEFDGRHDREHADDERNLVIPAAESRGVFQEDSLDVVLRFTKEAAEDASVGIGAWGWGSLAVSVGLPAANLAKIPPCKVGDCLSPTDGARRGISHIAPPRWSVASFAWRPERKIAVTVIPQCNILGCRAVVHPPEASYSALS